MSVHKEIKKICHLDLYRLKKSEEILYFGLEEEFSPRTDIVVIEWADMLELEHWEHFFAVTGCAKPKRLFTLEIKITPENLRTIHRSEQNLF